MKCNTCGRVVDWHAEVCNNCGRPKPARMRSSEIVIGLIALIGVGYYILTNETDNPASAPAAQVAEAAPAQTSSVATLQTEYPETPIAADSTDTPSPTEIASTSQNTHDASWRDESPVVSFEQAKENEAKRSIEAPQEQIPPSPKLGIYYFQVDTQPSPTTIEISALTPEKASQILRDFRGNPTVLKGPSTTVDW